jgi:hypothetical protein
MERFSPTVTGTDMHSWRSNLVYISTGSDSEGNAIFGTPHEKNSISYLVNGGYYSEVPITLTLENSPYVVDGGGAAVYSGGSLTIEPGVVIKVHNGSSVHAYGPVYALGTDSAPVIFTTLTDTTVGEGIPVRVDLVSGRGRFEDMQFHSGSDGSTLSNVYLNSIEEGVLFIDTSVTVDGLHISNSNYAITINGGQVVMNNVHIDNINRDAIDVYGGEMTLSNSRISGVEDGEGIGLYSASSTLTNVSISDIVDGDAIGMYTSSALFDEISVRNISYGSALAMYDSYAVIKNSLFQDGASAGIELYTSDLSMASSTVRQFLGEGIANYSSRADFSGVTVSENEIGIGAYGGEVAITLSNFFDNIEYGLYGDSDQSVNATGNWWGDATGPYSEEDNPTGLGDSIYGPVNFSGWLLEQI